MEKTRKITDKERMLINWLIEKSESIDDIPHIPENCRTMDDGKMGSISFDLSNSRSYGSDLIQVKYIDSDDVPVFITLTTDQEEDLFELDFWKVNFSKIIKYPGPEEVIKTTTNKL